MWDKLIEIDKRFQELEKELAAPETMTDRKRLQTLAKERSDIAEVADKFHEYRKNEKSIEETRSLLSGQTADDIKELAKEEIKELEKRQHELEAELTEAILPRDPNDEKNIIIEIRAGTGGDEAGLFAADLFRMYSRYALLKGYKVEVIDANENGAGGFREVVFEVLGKGAYSRFKYERGVHRVQRVPATEAAGRIHTSTATVAVLPEAEDVDVDINPADLRIDIFHSGSAGGQNVNKVSTAVRITHLPTGIVAVCQDERSQLRNRQKAMDVLRARLYDQQQREREEAETSERRAQVGNAERSEKVRTYNYPQDRLTDHRVGLSLHNLPKIMAGEMDELIDALATTERGEGLAAEEEE
jgi:peptide chain release factor 1